MQRRRSLHQRDPCLFGGRRVVANAAGNDEELAWMHRHRAAICFGAADAEHEHGRLGLHSGKEAVGLGPVAAVRLKGTLRHDKNSCGRRGLPLKLLAIAAISEYTRWDGIFTAECLALACASIICTTRIRIFVSASAETDRR